jgi:23S rRNA pseudouridine955/2504/2580 synthase
MATPHPSKIQTTIQTQTIGPTDAGQRLDRYLKRVCAGVPFVGLQKAIRTGAVRVNGRKVLPDFRLQARDVVTLPPQATQGTAAPVYTATLAEKQQLQSWVVHEDAQLLVINKPQGLPAQAGGGQVKSLDRLLVAAYGAANAPKLVHRLDRETTGLIICAKNRTSAAALGAQWAGRSVLKGYLALVLAESLGPRGDFTENIAKVGPHATISNAGDTAHTRWVKIGSVQPGVFLVLAMPLTGRMNQIRVHFAHHGYPLVGDDKYAATAGDFKPAKALAKQLGTGLALHAWQLQVQHPATGLPLQLQAPLPAAWAALLPPASKLLEQAAAAWQDAQNKLAQK